MKMPFPMWTQNTPAEIVLNADGLNENGAPIESATWAGPLWYSEKSRTVKDKEGRDVRLTGTAIIVGDVAPNLQVISDGTVTINGYVYRVFGAQRPRNPDGSIHHTTLELM